MNELIEDLKQKAIDHVDAVDGGLGIENYRELVDLKFAELIIFECMRVIKHNQGNSLTVSNFTDDKAQGIQLGLQFAVLDIADHFGVEE